MITEIKFKKLRENAKIPQRATQGSAGLDLCACIDEPVTLEKGGHALIPTGLAIALEDAGYAAMIFARSGLAIKHGIAPANCVGVVDSDYRGEICVGLINQYEESYTIEPGERIAQLIIMNFNPIVFNIVNSLSDTERSTSGFGSTGQL